LGPPTATGLTCDTSRYPPRLLLGTLQVLDISLPDSTVRVIRHTIPQYTYVDTVLPEDISGHMVSSRSEFIYFGCAEAILYGEPRNGSHITDSIISRCFTNCSSELPVSSQTHSGYCSGRYGCCHAPITAGSVPKRLNITPIDGNYKPLNVVLIMEEGLIDEFYMILNSTYDVVQHKLRVDISPCSTVGG
jgi:hypothetical protein